MLGRRLRTLRESKGLTLAEVAQRVKVTTPYLSMLETGVRTSPSLPLLRRLAKVFGVRVTTLLD
jgi:XRE family transcriptional regulator of biofilm formation